MALPVPLNDTAHPEHFPVTNKTTVKLVKSLLCSGIQQPAVGEEIQGCWLGRVCVSTSSVSLL